MAALLEEITKGARVRGIVPHDVVTVVDVRRHAADICEVVYKDSSGHPGTELIYRDQEAGLEVLEAGTLLSFTADGERFRLVFEALRIRLAHLFDPLLAVHSSQIIPLPHQITAVYGELIPRQPLRFLLADDPGSGKTVQAGLLIKELIARGDVRRCLVVAPGSLVEQWQDELYRKFDLAFDILTNDAARAAHSGNWFTEHPFCIARLDKLSRDEEMQAKLKAVDWDLVIVDEAHKLSASYFGAEAKYTKRYRLGQLLSANARHFLLMTATPHNGKETDFQLFLALLDGDRFEGKFRDGVHTEDASDLMRRLVKEKLVRFDGTPLFPERIAYTVPYTLSDAEAKLYAAVSSYVSDEFNRADQIANGSSKGNVGFALTSLQRRLASSPEAIYQSLRRRRERLEKRLREEQLRQQGEDTRLDLAAVAGVTLDDEDENDPLDDATDAEREAVEEKLLDEASAAQTIAELRIEISTLTRLEALANAVRISGTDRKWDELSHLLQTNGEMFGEGGARRKLVVFTEHRDTLNYLVQRIGNLLGRPDAVVCIHGGMAREERRNTQEAFRNHPDAQVLVATDAAGEGINLQNAHLMVNYDLPWNPNRLEQRFGRIHRIGQTEVCHLWNLVARQTREGDVYQRLLEKLDEERKALGGQVFDVLGQVIFGDQPLWKLLIEAVRYGDRPDIRAKLFAQVEGALDRKHLRELLEQRALVEDAMDLSVVRRIREEMERAEARRLQPHFIEGFFLAAFDRLGGSIRPREGKRYEVTWVPAAVRRRDRVVGQGEAVLSKYERVTFERDAVMMPGKPQAALLCPGHPLLDATVSLIIEQYREMLKRGAILVDPADDGEEPRLMWALEHDIRDGRLDKDGARRVISKRLVFVEQTREGECRAAGYAPYLDYRPLEDGERPLLDDLLSADWLHHDLETQAVTHAISTVVPDHYYEIRKRRDAHITKTRAAVHARLTTEIGYWDHRTEELRLREEAGAQPKFNSQNAARRRDDLIARLQRRMEELDLEERISRTPPVVMGGALIVPIGYLRRAASLRALSGDAPLAVSLPPALFGARDTREVERLAMAAVMAAERALGFEPKDVSGAKIGYDIESKVPNEGRLRFIEVKGRVVGAETVTVTKNEILTALNKPDDFILAIVEVADGTAAPPRYVRQPFTREPDFAVSSITYVIRDLLAQSVDPK